MPFIRGSDSKENKKEWTIKWDDEKQNIQIDAFVDISICSENREPSHSKVPFKLFARLSASHFYVICWILFNYVRSFLASGNRMLFHSFITYEIQHKYVKKQQIVCHTICYINFIYRRLFCWNANFTKMREKTLSGSLQKSRIFI